MVGCSLLWRMVSTRSSSLSPRKARSEKSRRYRPIQMLSAFPIPARSLFPGKSDLPGIGNAESIWIGRYRRDFSERAFRGESDELRVETILHNSEQPTIFGPAVVEDRPVHAGAGEIMNGLVAVMSEHEVVRRRAVLAAADERHLQAIRGDADIDERPARSEDLHHRVDWLAVATGNVPETKGKNALGVLIRLGMIRGTEHQTGAGRMPNGLVDFPFRFGEGFAFSSVECEEPETGALIFFVRNVRVVFVFFLLFFRFSFCVGGKKGNLLAVGRPGKILHAALSFGQGAGFAAVCPHGVDLLLIIAV